MKAIITGIIAAAAFAAAAAFVLDTRVQQTADQRFQTTGVRL
ncbi:MAG: hypothetical protein N3D18_05695 [Roseococcus sp.]|nr:hypothetical protein [Roseococcus sp.]